MPEFGFTLTEHDLDRPWIITRQEHRTVTVDDSRTFFDWAAERWPEPRWTVQLDPWQLAPDPLFGKPERSTPEP